MTRLSFHANTARHASCSRCLALSLKNGDVATVIFSPQVGQDMIEMAPYMACGRWPRLHRSSCGDVSLTAGNRQRITPPQQNILPVSISMPISRAAAFVYLG
ncbi:hypothetical protein ACD592_12575 [Rhizobium sp. 969_B3_N1_2]|uniref:hypothetical protein n=1 Tax=Rhizobium sp. 969_B3_N1_2 TaxID=3276278 RepID=UPI003F21ED54